MKSGNFSSVLSRECRDSNKSKKFAGTERTPPPPPLPKRQESVSGLEAALEVANRACSPFLRWRPEALFFRAELLERLGRKDEARGVYQRVLSEVRRFFCRSEVFGV